MKWDDSKTFLFETIRTVAFAVVGTILTFQVVKRWEHGQDYQAQLDSERLKMRLAVVDDFLRSAYAYTSLTHDVLTCKAASEELSQWQGSAFDAYASDLSRLQIYFPEVMSKHRIQQRSEYLGLLKAAFDARKCDRGSWTKTRLQLKDLNDVIANAALVKLGVVEKLLQENHLEALESWPADDGGGSVHYDDL